LGRNVHSKGIEDHVLVGVGKHRGIKLELFSLLERELEDIIAREYFFFEVRRFEKETRIKTTHGGEMKEQSE